MNARFYAPDARATGDVVRLPDDEAQHLTRVLRLGAGEAVRVFDGRGCEFDGVVAEVSKGGVFVRLGATREAVPEPKVAITLAQAALKGDKMDEVVRDAVMIGAAAIQPIVTARTEVSLAALARGHRRERWERIAVSSAKQCGRSVVPAVLEPIAATTLFDSLEGKSAPALLLAEPSTGVSSRLSDLDAAAPPHVTLIIGPEGGWTPEELERARGCRLVTLGARTLRADAMAIVAIAALFSMWHEY